MPQPNMTTDPNLKFTPGAGTTPPLLAGREREKAVIIEALDYLGEGCNPAANIALIGPRGNGKTALLQWVKTHADHYGGKIKCVILKPGCFRSHSDLLEALADHGGCSRPSCKRTCIFGKHKYCSDRESACRNKRPRQNCSNPSWRK